MSRLTARAVSAASDSNVMPLTRVNTERFIRAPRVIKYPGLSTPQTAGLLLAVMAGLGLLYWVGVALASLWRWVGLVLWVPRG